MVIAVFRTRVRPETNVEYMRWAARMAELARAMPGYVSHEGFAAYDGERVTIVEFETMDALLTWSAHPEHVAEKNKAAAASTSITACKSATSSANRASRFLDRMAHWVDTSFERAQRSAWRRATYY